MLNVTAPPVALSAIARDTGAGFTALQWVLSAYALCLAVLQLGAGRIADLVGRRRTFLVAMTAFSLASLLCAAAPGAEVLVVGRALQGAAAAAVFASSIALLADAFEGPGRGRAIGIWGGTLALAFAAGPVVGGALVDLVSWRAIFAAGILPAGLAILLAARHARESGDPAAAGLDIPGVALAAAAMSLLLFGIVSGNDFGWSDPAVVSSFAAGAVAASAFVLVERRQPAPMLDLTLFSNRTFNGASLMVLLMSMANFGAYIYLTYFLLVVRESSPIEVGLMLAPSAIATFSVSVLAPRLLPGIPLAARFAAGQTLLAAGLWALSGLDAESSWTYLLPGLVLSGAGIGLTNPLSTQTLLAVLPPAHAGLASGINNTARQLGVAMGTAVMGVILQARVGTILDGSAALNAAPAGSRAEVLERLEGPDPSSGLDLVPQQARAGVRGAYEAAYASALDTVLLVGVGLAVAGIALAILLVRERDLYVGGGG